MLHRIARVLGPLARHIPLARGEEARRQRERRRALLLAAYGIDVGPRRIHGVQVTA